MPLYDVLVSLLIDADSRDDAMKKTREFLSGGADLDCNFLVHNAELTGNDGDTLADLRDRQTGQSCSA